jgi:hypothetical protein
MSLFADLRRRFDPFPFRSAAHNLAGSPGQASPGSSSEFPCGWREPHGVPGIHRNAYLAIAEALQDGADVVPASREVGRRLAEDGVSLLEALDGLSALYRSYVGGEPAFDAVRALSSSWSESSLNYLHSLTCEDPLTGLASMAHVRSRLGEIYREAELRGTAVPASHALVVVEPLWRPDLSNVDRELRLVDVAECLRVVFCGGEVLGRAGHRRAVALVARDPGLSEHVDTVRTLLAQWRLDANHPQRARIWIEGLPASVEWAGRALDELART